MREYKFIQRHPSLKISNAVVKFRNGYKMSVLRDLEGSFAYGLEIAIIKDGEVFYGSELLPYGVQRVDSMKEAEAWARKIAKLPKI